MLEVVPGLANNLCWCETKEVCNTVGKKNTKSLAGEIIGQGMRATKKGAVTLKDCVRQIAKVSLNLIPDYELFCLHHKSKAQAGCNILIFLFSSKPIAVKN